MSKGPQMGENSLVGVQRDGNIGKRGSRCVLGVIDRDFKEIRIYSSALSWHSINI